MAFRHDYEKEPSTAMGVEGIGIYFYRGSIHLTLTDNLSLIAGLEIYGVESITHTYTYIMQ